MATRTKAATAVVDETATDEPIVQTTKTTAAKSAAKAPAKAGSAKAPTAKATKKSAKA
ncbi:MAG: hypothetical protein JWP75_590, partial [Frondihabitans sp.]|nr:hypothetical protein [Frondihabitans sp.]